jgi:hypothetical protein
MKSTFGPAGKSAHASLEARGEKMGVGLSRNLRSILRKAIKRRDLERFPKRSGSLAVANDATIAKHGFSRPAIHFSGPPNRLPARTSWSKRVARRLGSAGAAKVVCDCGARRREISIS